MASMSSRLPESDSWEPRHCTSWPAHPRTVGTPVLEETLPKGV